MRDLSGVLCFPLFWFDIWYHCIMKWKSCWFSWRMRQLTRQMIGSDNAMSLFGTKPLSEPVMGYYQLKLNTLGPRQNGRRFADGTFKHIFLNENVRISIKISLKFVPKGPINNNPALVQIMAWRRFTMWTKKLVYWRIYASLRLNELRNEIWINVQAFSLKTLDLETSSAKAK